MSARALRWSVLVVLSLVAGIAIGVCHGPGWTKLVLCLNFGAMYVSGYMDGASR